MAEETGFKQTAVSVSGKVHGYALEVHARAVYVVLGTQARAPGVHCWFLGMHGRALPEARPCSFDSNWFLTAEPAEPFPAIRFSRKLSKSVKTKNALIQC